MLGADRVVFSPSMKPANSLARAGWWISAGVSSSADRTLNVRAKVQLTISGKMSLIAEARKVPRPREKAEDEAPYARSASRRRRGDAIGPLQ